MLVTDGERGGREEEKEEKRRRIVNLSSFGYNNVHASFLTASPIYI